MCIRDRTKLVKQKILQTKLPKQKMLQTKLPKQKTRQTKLPKQQILQTKEKIWQTVLPTRALALGSGSTRHYCG